jgi:xanthine dehydrogenase accessory factor
MSHWLDDLEVRLAAENAVVRVSVAAVRGSAPREAGACMLVGRGEGVSGTIGGGHLEWKAIAIAREMLEHGERGRLDRLSLGATLGQCCGGVVELWFERFDGADRAFIEQARSAAHSDQPTALHTSLNTQGSVRRELRPCESTAPRAARLRQGVDVLVERIDSAQVPVWIFGAGHVGSALVKALADMPYRITWVDSREEQFAPYQGEGRLPENVMPLASDSPADEVKHAPPGAFHLVLTHSHDLDYDITRALLAHGRFAWFGLIGSKTKAAKFRNRLERQGFTHEEIGRITCPIGVEGIDSKFPAAIAIAVSAQLLQAVEANAKHSSQGVSRGTPTAAAAAGQREHG